MGDYRWDKLPRKVLQVLVYSGQEPYRYILKDLPNASFTERQLRKATEKEEVWKVREIIGKKTVKKVVYYLVWWKGYTKDESTYEPKHKLVEDGLEDLIKEFERKRKN